MKILIIDDHHDTADILSMLLNLVGHETWVSYTGQGGLAAVELFQPDLVILDVGLPDTTGYEVVRRIRSTGNQVRVIGVTGRNDAGAALEAGFSDHLLKPVGLTALNTMIMLDE